MQFLLLLSTCFIIASSQAQYRPTINIKLDDQLQWVKSSNGQIKIMLKNQSPLFVQPQQTGLQLVTTTEKFIEPESVLLTQPDISTALESQTSLQPIPRLDMNGPSIDINPMAITASVVNPALPSILQIVRNLLKLVCDGVHSNHKSIGSSLFGFNKFCDERNWTESIFTNQINQILSFIQSHLPRIGLKI